MRARVVRFSARNSGPHLFKQIVDCEAKCLRNAASSLQKDEVVITCWRRLGVGRHQPDDPFSDLPALRPLVHLRSFPPLTEILTVFGRTFHISATGLEQLTLDVGRWPLDP